MWIQQIRNHASEEKPTGIPNRQIPSHLRPSTLEKKDRQRGKSYVCIILTQKFNTYLTLVMDFRASSGRKLCRPFNKKNFH